MPAWWPVCSRGGASYTEDYFTAGGRLGSWFSTIVVGLSIAGTFFSGISFIATPQVAYSYGAISVFWNVLFCMPLCYVILRYWFLPRYLSGGWTYPYDIFEARYGDAARTVAASLYILLRIGWMAVMIYAPTVAVMTMARLGDDWFWPIVLITGLTNTFFTVVSGVRGVIVTEAIQMLVIFGGISATIAAALWQMPVPLSTAWQTLEDAGRLEVVDFSLDLQRPSLSGR